MAIDLDNFARHYVDLVGRATKERAGLAIPTLIAEMGVRMAPEAAAGAIASTELQLGFVTAAALPARIAELVDDLMPGLDKGG